MYTTEELENGINIKIQDGALGKEQVILSSEDRKHSKVSFIYGWKLSYSISCSTIGNSYPRLSGFQDCGSTATAAETAKQSVRNFQSGRNTLYVDRLKKHATADVSGFALTDIDLGNPGTVYFGCDNCSSCFGKGKKTCYQCSYGKTGCHYCSGSGSRQEQSYDANGRSTWVMVSCNACWGSGQVNCQSCGGSGQLTCQSCHGSGEEYTSYAVQGIAKRTTNFSIENDNCHHWTTDFINSRDNKITGYLQNIIINSRPDNSDGYSVSFQMDAWLATLEYTASLPAGQTLMKFAGENDTIIDAGCIMDCSVWALTANLGTTGSLTTDKTILAAPAVKQLLDHHEQKKKKKKKQSELLTDNWVSLEIYQGVVEKYETMVKYLESNNRKGFFSNFLIWSTGIAALLTFITFFTGVLIPATIHYQFVTDWTPLNYFRPQYFLQTWGIFTQYIDYGRNSELVLGAVAILFFIMYKAVPKIYWKNKIGKIEKIIATLLIFWVPGYFVVWVVTLFHTANYGMGRPYDNNIEWHIYGARILSWNAYDIAFFSLFFAACVTHRRLCKKTNATIKAYDSDILNRRFKLI